MGEPRGIIGGPRKICPTENPDITANAGRGERRGALACARVHPAGAHPLGRRGRVLAVVRRCARRGALGPPLRRRRAGASDGALWARCWKVQFKRGPADRVYTSATLDCPTSRGKRLSRFAKRAATARTTARPRVRRRARARRRARRRPRSPTARCPSRRSSRCSTSCARTAARGGGERPLRFVDFGSGTGKVVLAAALWSAAADGAAAAADGAPPAAVRFDECRGVELVPALTRRRPRCSARGARARAAPARRRPGSRLRVRRRWLARAADEAEAAAPGEGEGAGAARGAVARGRPRVRVLDVLRQELMAAIGGGAAAARGRVARHAHEACQARRRRARAAARAQDRAPHELGERVLTFSSENEGRERAASPPPSQKAARQNDLGNKSALWAWLSSSRGEVHVRHQTRQSELILELGAVEGIVPAGRAIVIQQARRISAARSFLHSF